MSRIYHSHVMNTILSDKTRHTHVRIFPHKPNISSHFPRNPFFLTCYLSGLHTMMPVKQNAHNVSRKIRQSFLKLQTCRKFVNRSSN
jgi:hypothetical protein